jgi:multidrug transporter EmrE-like cation transporter
LSLTVFLAMIASAFLHATWNAWVKSRRDSNAAVACLVIGAGFPNLVVIAAFGWPAAPAWPWIACTVTLSIGSLTLLAKAYREGDFAVAFPMIRGLIPVVLVLAAVPLFGETPRLAGAAGVICVSAGLGLIGWESARRTRTMTLRGLGFVALAAAVTAASVMMDAKGARLSENSYGYAATIAVLNAVVMWIVQRLRGDDVPAMLVRQWPVTIGRPRSRPALHLVAAARARGARRRVARDEHAVRAPHRAVRARRALRRLALGRRRADARRHGADAALRLLSSVQGRGRCRAAYFTGTRQISCA